MSPATPDSLLELSGKLSWSVGEGREERPAVSPILLSVLPLYSFLFFCVLIWLEREDVRILGSVLSFGFL